MSEYTARDIARFWSKVDKSGGPDSCWVWTASRNQKGYGMIKMHGRTHLAPRIAWELTRGTIPDGLNVLHDCPDGDNPACCNPAHLWLGTHTDNMQDKMRKGRQGASGSLPGDESNNHKLTAAQVAEIRYLYAQGGMTQTELGQRFGVTRGNIWLIVHDKKWSS